MSLTLDRVFDAHLNPASTPQDRETLRIHLEKEFPSEVPKIRELCKLALSATGSTRPDCCNTLSGLVRRGLISEQEKKVWLAKLVLSVYKPLKKVDGDWPMPDQRSFELRDLIFSHTLGLWRDDLFFRNKHQPWSNLEQPLQEIIERTLTDFPNTPEERLKEMEEMFFCDFFILDILEHEKFRKQSPAFLKLLDTYRELWQSCHPGKQFGDEFECTLAHVHPVIQLLSRLPPEALKNHPGWLELGSKWAIRYQSSWLGQKEIPPVELFLADRAIPRPYTLNTLCEMYRMRRLGNTCGAFETKKIEDLFPQFPLLLAWECYNRAKETDCYLDRRNRKFVKDIAEDPTASPNLVIFASFGYWCLHYDVSRPSTLNALFERFIPLLDDSRLLEAALLLLEKRIPVYARVQKYDPRQILYHIYLHFLQFQKSGASGNNVNSQIPLWKQASYFYFHMLFNQSEFLSHFARKRQLPNLAVSDDAMCKFLNVTHDELLKTSVNLKEFFDTIWLALPVNVGFAAKFLEVFLEGSLSIEEYLPQNREQRAQIGELCFDMGQAFREKYSHSKDPVEKEKLKTMMFRFYMQVPKDTYYYYEALQARVSWFAETLEKDKFHMIVKPLKKEAREALLPLEMGHVPLATAEIIKARAIVDNVMKIIRSQ